MESARALGAGHVRTMLTHVPPDVVPTIIVAAVALSLAVFGFDMLGDALRGLLDPRLEGG